MIILQAERNRHRDDGKGRWEMNAVSRGLASSVIPTFRYHDAPAAIEWLCDTFGFEKRLVVPGDDQHARCVGAHPSPERYVYARRVCS